MNGKQVPARSVPLVARLLEWDSTLSARVRVAERSGPLRSLAVFLAHSGDSWVWLAGLAAVWATRILYWQRRAAVLTVGVLVTAVIVLTLKFAFRRRRPEGVWGNIYRRSDPHSFPSGHAARAAMLAVLAITLGPRWLGVVLLVWAPLVALARVVMGLHFLSDILVGMLVGVILALIIMQFVPPDLI